MAKFGILLLILGSLSFWIYNKLTTFSYDFVKLESYNGGKDHFIITVKRDGYLFNKEIKAICDQKKEVWFYYERPGNGVKGPCGEELDKILRKIYSVNRDRLDFDEQFPDAHLS